MKLFSRSAILPATPVHSSGIRALKSPRSTSAKTPSSTTSSSSSVLLVIRATSLDHAGYEAVSRSPSRPWFGLGRPGPVHGNEEFVGLDNHRASAAGVGLRAPPV